MNRVEIAHLHINSVKIYNKLMCRCFSKLRKFICYVVIYLILRENFVFQYEETDEKDGAEGEEKR